MERGSHYGADAQLVYGQMATEQARRAQAEALASGLLALGRALGRAASAVGGWLSRHVVAPLGARARRRRAIAHMRDLDARLLADIGLRRGEIELAVDGHLHDGRVRHPRREAPTSPTRLRPVPADAAVIGAANRNPQRERFEPVSELRRAS